jgi:hypothetical protein
VALHAARLVVTGPGQEHPRGAAPAAARRGDPVPDLARLRLGPPVRDHGPVRHHERLHAERRPPVDDPHRQSGVPRQVEQPPLPVLLRPRALEVLVEHQSGEVPGRPRLGPQGGERLGDEVSEVLHPVPAVEPAARQQLGGLVHAHRARIRGHPVVRPDTQLLRGLDQVTGRVVDGAPKPAARRRRRGQRSVLDRGEERAVDGPQRRRSGQVVRGCRGERGDRPPHAGEPTPGPSRAAARKAPSRAAS